MFGLVSLANPAALLLRAGRGELATEVVSRTQGREGERENTRVKQTEKKEEAGRRRAREERKG